VSVCPCLVLLLVAACLFVCCETCCECLRQPSTGRLGSECLEWVGSTFKPLALHGGCLAGGVSKSLSGPFASQPGNPYVDALLASSSSAGEKGDFSFLRNGRRAERTVHPAATNLFLDDQAKGVERLELETVSRPTRNIARPFLRFTGGNRRSQAPRPLVECRRASS